MKRIVYNQSIYCTLILLNFYPTLYFLFRVGVLTGEVLVNSGLYIALQNILTMW